MGHQHKSQCYPCGGCRAGGRSIRYSELNSLRTRRLCGLVDILITFSHALGRPLQMQISVGNGQQNCHHERFEGSRANIQETTTTEQCGLSGNHKIGDHQPPSSDYASLGKGPSEQEHGSKYRLQAEQQSRFLGNVVSYPTKLSAISGTHGSFTRIKSIDICQWYTHR